MFVIFILVFFYLTGNNAQLEVRDYNKENWTTCEQFLANTTFDELKLLDVDWKIFYFWSIHLEDSYNIRFSVPTSTLVDRFRVELDEVMRPPVTWRDASLFLESSIDFSALLIKSNKPGLYKLVPSFAFQYPHLAVSDFGVKYVEPGYLGIMNCRQRLCFALAPVDKMPANDALETEAKKLGFYSEIGRSYIDGIVSPTVEPPPEAEPLLIDDDEEDEQFEIDNNPANFQVF